MVDTKIIAIGVVALLVVAGAAFVLVSDDGDEYRSPNLEGRLLIMGNADNDDYIDDRDIEKLESLIGTGDGWRETNPLADTDDDGDLDRDDVDMLRRIVDREAMTLNYAYVSGDDLVVSSVDYPITNMVVVGDNVALGLKILGAGSMIRGIALSDADDPMYSDLKGIPSIRGTSTTVPSLSLISNVADADTVLVTTTSTRYVTNEAEIVQSGVPVVRFNVDGGESGLESMMGTLTMGFLLDREEQANDYTRFCDSILSEVSEKTADIADRATCIATNRTTNVSGVSSEYHPLPILAGGVNVITGDTTFTSWKPGMDWLYGYEFDYIIHSTSLGFGDVDGEAEYESYSSNFSNLQAYADGNFVLLNANLPAPLRVAYIASVFYPEVFGEDYGDELAQEVIDGYIDNLSGEYDVTTDACLIQRA